jgi:hypothetical protein
VNTETVKRILADPSRTRPIFHNEADFQYALAVEIQRFLPAAHIRLERQVMPQGKPRMYIDVECEFRGRRTAFELKYVTQALSVAEGNEHFLLMSQGAPDTRRYDVVRDVERLESVVHQGIADIGFLIAITNDAAYWQAPRSNAPNDAAFRLHENRQLTGTLDWAEDTGPGQKSGRDRPVVPSGTYTLEWSDFSVVASGVAGPFLCLLIGVTR